MSESIRSEQRIMSDASKYLSRCDVLRNLVDSLPEQMAYWDENLICRYANRAYLQIFSLPLDKIVGIHMRDLLGDELFDANRAVIANVLQGSPQAFVRSLTKRDGSRAEVHVKYVPNSTADRRVNGFYVSVHDVTSFKKIERDLLEKENELRALVAKRDDVISWMEMAEEVAHVGHWRVSLPAGSVTWSDEMYRIIGVERHVYQPELTTALKFYHPEYISRLRAATEQTLADGQAYDELGRVVRPDGDVRYVRTRGKATLGPDGRPTSVFGILLDVTDQQNAEEALRLANERLQAIADIDGLTGINNRRRFDEALDLEWRTATRSGSALSLVLIDVDHFKTYNDTYGHQAGDDCLRAVAAAIGSAITRPQDMIARYGGEEFVILLPATDHAGATLVAERARFAVEEIGRKHEGSAHGLVTVSAGVGSIRPMLFGRDAQRCLVAEADSMLYRAKANGRNSVVCDPDATSAEQACEPILVGGGAHRKALAPRPSRFKN